MARMAISGVGRVLLALSRVLLRRCLIFSVFRNLSRFGFPIEIELHRIVWQIAGTIFRRLLGERDSAILPTLLTVCR